MFTNWTLGLALGLSSYSSDISEAGSIHGRGDEIGTPKNFCSDFGLQDTMWNAPRRGDVMSMVMSLVSLNRWTGVHPPNFMEGNRMTNKKEERLIMIIM